MNQLDLLMQGYNEKWRGCIHWQSFAGILLAQRNKSNLMYSTEGQNLITWLKGQIELSEENWKVISYAFTQYAEIVSETKSSQIDCIINLSELSDEERKGFGSFEDIDNIEYS